MNKFLKSIIAIFCATAAMAMSVPAWSLDASHFANDSKLASGKWVKIQVATDGVYQITDAELKAMGFEKPAEVKIFGNGGIILPESLEAVASDDIAQVPAIYVGGKLCFYAQGTNKLDTYYSTAANFLRFTANSYSSKSYYFLTDNTAYASLAVPEANQPTSSAEASGESANCLHHERELYSPGLTGKTILGEDFGSAKKLDFDFELPGYVDGSAICIYTVAAMKANERTELSAKVNSTDMTFAVNTNKINAVASDYTYYNICQARATVVPDNPSDDKFRYSLSATCTGNIALARLDNFTVTYRQHNELHPGSSQMNMYILNESGSKSLKVSGITPTTLLWDVTQPAKLKQYALTRNGNEGKFTASLTALCSKFVLFDTSRELMKIDGFAAVGNQNLHAMSTPDMVIITSPGLKAQAQRIADMHITRDKMEVAVVEQPEIFNEFSSGAVDATAIRMFMKMLHKRNPSKLKYLLLFGGGTFDNRHLLGEKNENLLVTFQSTTSNVETKSYTCDDYFGMLGDNCGYSIAAAPVTIAVGRMPVKTEAEAENAVDKLLRYIDADFGTWCNNVLVIADEGDNDMHMYQAEGAITTIENSDMRPAVNKVFKEAFPVTNGFDTDARAKIINELQRGQVFVTYVGHGDPKLLSKSFNLWRLQDSHSVENEYLPFFSFAACDVARFDSDMRGLAEELFHNPKGGMIAGMASTRTVFASENDELNVALIKNLFNLDENGEQRTIGEAYRMAKHTFDPYENSNKLNFLLIGDPAMKLHYPVNRIVIDRVNGVDVTADGAVADVYPMSEVKVSGSISNADGSLNDNFSGKVYLSLYDKTSVFKSLKMSSDAPVRDSYTQRELLSTADGNVEDGKFEMSIMVPARCLAQGEMGVIRAVAHSTGSSTTIVDGVTNNVRINAFAADKALTDSEAPVIETMYLNDDSFGEGDVVDSSVTMFATITDNIGVCTQTLALGNGIDVSLDNGTVTYGRAKNIASVYDNGKSAHIVLPIDNLSFGKHTLTLSASDMAGNRTSHSIDFFVQPESCIASVEASENTVRESAVFSISHELEGNYEATIVVLDSTGRTIWRATTADAQCTWNLTDTDGNAVLPGLYRYYCTVRTATGYANSPAGEIVVLSRQ